ncbi:quinone oxidoreductase-like protein 1 isoform X1 [Dysidea avara]|uniref:quinone oxidoreductase-like protein 1 isoform X1 n=1 Tax=Dysidea avara TaxID=196820 RepID=UPI0033229461
MAKTLQQSVLPMDTTCSGCADHCVIPKYCLVKKPKTVSHIDCAAVMEPGIMSLTIILHQARLTPGSTVLIFSGCSATGVTLMQLFASYGAKVIAVVDNSDGAKLLSSLEPWPSWIIDMSSQEKSLVDICLQETGGLGVDCVVDGGQCWLLQVTHWIHMFS